MSPLLSSANVRGPSRQRGAIGLIGALTLTMALLATLLVVDSGRLYLEKRKLQQIADTAALEAVSRKGSCVTPASTAAGYVLQSANRNGFTVSPGSTLITACGVLVTAASNLRTFSVDASKSNAIRVIASRPVQTSLAAGVAMLVSGANLSANTQLTATAVAASPDPLLAQLTIRSTVADVSLLSPLFSGLLGSSVNISLASWQNLLGANISLLKYLDQAAIDLGVTAGNYDQLLATNTTVGKLLNTAVTVAQANGATIDIINSLSTLKNAAVSTAVVTLGDVLKLQTGTQSAGVDTQFNLFQLVQGFAQLSNYRNTVAADVPVSLLGLGLGATAKIRVTEPPQFSMIGNPALAKANPTGATTQIYVRTAQVRALVSLDLSLVTNIVSGVTGLLNVVTSVLGFQLNVLPNPSLDVSIEAGGGNSHVTDYTCVNDTNKSLTISSTSEAARLRIGRVNSNWASSTTPMTVTPITVIDIESKACLTCSFVPYGGGGIDLQIDVPVLQTTAPYTFINPNKVNVPPSEYFSVSASNAVSSLSTSVNGITFINHPPTFTPNLVQAVAFGLVTTTLTTAVTLVGNALSSVLGPLLDNLINKLLLTLGINLNKVETGGNLNCGQTGLAYLVI